MKLNTIRKVCIYGAGRHGKVIMDLIESIPEMQLEMFIDDSVVKQNKDFHGYKVVSFKTYLENNKRKLRNILITISDNIIRRRIYNVCKKSNCEIPNLIHPSAILSKNIKLGNGIQILPGVVINIDASLGNNSIIHSGVILDHDCRIEDNVSIWPGAKLAGGVTIREDSYIGTNATIIPDTKVGKNSIIGAGAVVIRDIPDNVTAVGVPAKIIKWRKRLENT